MAQRERGLELEVRALIEQRYPEGEQHFREVALESARRALTEEGQVFGHLRAAAGRYHLATQALEEARAELTGAIAATRAPETTIAEVTGVTRMTVRKARGK